MNKFFIFLLSIFILTFTLAAPTVTLNSPTNNSVSFIPLVTMNASGVAAAGTTILNISRWDNSSGTWARRNTTILGGNLINTNFSNGNSFLQASGNGNVPNLDWNSLAVNGNDAFGASNNSFLTSPSGTYWMISRAHQGHIVYLNRTLTASSLTGNLSFNYRCANDNNGGAVNCFIAFYNSSGLIGSITSIPDSSGESSFSTTIPAYTTKIQFTVDNTAGGGFGAQLQFYNLISNISANTQENFSFSSTFNTSSIKWNYQYCANDSSCSFAANNFSFFLDSTSPSIMILGGNGTQNFGSLSQNHTITYFVNDTNLDTCWISYNGTNRTDACVNAVPKYYNFTMQEGVYNLTIYANDTLGNVQSLFVSWNYKIFQTNVDYNPSVMSGLSENYGLNLTISPLYELTTSDFYYNGTYISSSTITSQGNTRYSNISNFPVPSVSTPRNFTFFWILALNDSTNINTTNVTQLVNPVNLDNCSTYIYPILNVNLFDERTRNPLNGTIEVTYQVLNTPFYDLVYNLTGKFTNVSSTRICSEMNLTGQGFVYSAQFKYYSAGYVSELFNIQRSTIADVQNVSLFDLEEAESTTFQITYQDDNLIKIAEAIIQLQRKYISSDVYEVVEAPLTSTGGTAVLHIDLDANIYRVTVVKNGEVLNVFDNVAFNCENPLAGQCTQNLYGNLNPENEISVDEINDFASSIYEIGNNTLQVDFTIPSGTPATVSIILTQRDVFGNTTTCNRTVFSSAGSVQCTFNETVTQSYVDLVISKNSKPITAESFMVKQDLNLVFGGNNFFIIFVFLVSLIGMAITSPEFMVINAVVTLLIAGGLGLANGLDLVIGLGTLGWIIVAAIIIISKLAKQEDR